MSESERQITLRWVTVGLPLSLAVVLWVTLYPFVLACPSGLGPGTWLQQLLFGASHMRDVLGNLALFVPLGLMVAALAATLRASRPAQLLATLVAGASVSLLVETLQLCMGSRFAALVDVGSNSSGALIGGLIWLHLGGPILRGSTAALTMCGRKLAPWSLWLLVAYGVAALALSTVMQTETLPRNWGTKQSLVIGNERGRAFPWEGAIAGLAILDRPLTTADLGAELPSDAHVLTAYRFTEGRIDSWGAYAATLHPRGKRGPQLRAEGAQVGEQGWLISAEDMPDLIRRVRRSDAVSVVVHLTDNGQAQSGPARLLTIAVHGAKRNLALLQQSDNLIVHLRSSVSRSDGRWLEYVFPDVFGTPGERRLAVSYDGAEMKLFVDGVAHPTSYDVGPGAALAARWLVVYPHMVRPWSDLYVMLLMLPWALGIAVSWRQDRPVEAIGAIVGAIGFLALFALSRALVIERPWQLTDMAAGLIAGTGMTLITLWLTRPLDRRRSSARGSVVLPSAIDPHPRPLSRVRERGDQWRARRHPDGRHG